MLYLYLKWSLPVAAARHHHLRADVARISEIVARVDECAVEGLEAVEVDQFQGARFGRAKAHKVGRLHIEMDALFEGSGKNYNIFHVFLKMYSLLICIFQSITVFLKIYFYALLSASGPPPSLP